MTHRCAHWFALLVLCVLPLSAQEPAQFSTSVDVRVLRVAVRDANGIPVLGLSERDFVVEEHGSERSIQFVDSAADLGLRVVLLIDRSRSMRPESPWGYGDAREVALRFLSRLTPDDCVLPIAFHHQVAVAAWMPVGQALRDLVQGVAFDGGTAVYAALLEAHAQLAALKDNWSGAASGASSLQHDLLEAFQFQPYEQRLLRLGAEVGANLSSPPPCGSPETPALIVVVTDGRDTVDRATGLHDVLRAVARHRVPIIVGAVSMFGDRPREPGEGIPAVERLMRPVAEASGGGFYDTSTLSRAYDRVSEHVEAARGQYLLGYRTTIEQTVSRGEITVGAVRTSHRVVVTADYGAAATGTARRTADALDLTLRGFDAYARGSFTEAELAFRSALDLEPDVAAAYFGLGVVYWEQRGESADVAEQAVAALAQAVRLAPWLSSAHARMAILESERGNDQSATRHALVAVQGDPRHTPSVSALLGAPTDAARDIPRIFLLPPVADDARAKHALDRGLVSLGRAIVNHPQIALTSEGAHATHAARMELQPSPFRGFRSDAPVQVGIHVFARDDGDEVDLDFVYRYRADDDSALEAAAVQVVDEIAAALEDRPKPRRHSIP